MNQKKEVRQPAITGVSDIIASLRYGYQPRFMREVVSPALSGYFKEDSERTVEQLLREVALALKKTKIAFITFIKFMNVVKFAVSAESTIKKDQGLNNRFGEAAIVLSSVYLSAQHYTAQQTKTKIHRLSGLLNFVQDTILIARLEKALSSNSLGIITLCLETLSNRKQQILAEPMVFSKLLDEYFIDTKRRDPKALSINPTIARLINSANLRDIIAPKLSLLLKRSEDNIETIVSVLSCLENERSYDSSSWAADTCLIHLKPYYFSLTDQTVPSKAAALAIKFIKQASVLQQVIEGIALITGQTNDEKKRMPMIKILDGVTKALKHVEGDSRGVTTKAVQILADNAGAVQTTEDLEDYLRIVDNLFANSSNEFVFSADLAALLKRKIAVVQANRFVYAAVAKLTSGYVSRYANLRESMNEVKELVDAVIVNVLQPILKAPAKIVSSTEQFLAALELTVLAAGYAPLAGLAAPELKKSLKAVLLSEKTFLNKTEFFEKLSQLEANLYFKSILDITQLEEIDIHEDHSTFITLANTFTQLFFGSAKPASTVSINSLLKSNKVKSWSNLTSILATGLFNFLFYSLDKQSQANPEKLHLATRLLGKCISHLSPSEVVSNTSSQLLPWLMGHPVTHHITRAKFTKTLQKNNFALRDAFISFISSSQLANPFLLISDQMLQSSNEQTREATRGYVRFLMQLEQFEFLQAFSPTLEIANFELKNSKVIQQFEFVVIKTSDDFEAKEQSTLLVLASLGYKVNAVAPVAAVSANEPKKGGNNSKKVQPIQQQQAPKEASISAHKLFEPYLPVYRFRLGHQFLDDEELVAKNKEELRERMTHFFRLACEFFRIFSVTSSTGVGSSANNIASFFFTHLNESFFGVAREKSTHSNYKVILANILRKYKAELKSQAAFLADFTVTIAQRENPSEKMIREFINFQSLVNASILQDEKAQTFIIPFFNQLNMHTIREDGFDLDTKSNAMIFYLQLSSDYDKYLIDLFEHFNSNINTLAANPVAQQLLEKILLIIEKNQTSLLFRHFLNNVTKAKLCVLNAIINQSSKIDYTPSFEENIKLRIIQIDQNEQLQKAAIKILGANADYEVNTADIQKFDIISFVVDHSIENVDKFSELCLDFIKTQPLLHKTIFSKLLEAADVCYDKQITEEALTFFPKYVMQHIGNVKEDELSSIFNLLVQKYCNPGMNMLIDVSLQCGIDLIKKFGATQANSLVQIFEKFLKSNNPEDANKQISAIVFLGVCAPFIKNKALIENVSTKIVLLFKNGTESLQKSLAKCLPQLMNFFENASGLIEKTLLGLPYEPTIVQKKGQAYLIAGLVKGLGVAYIEKLNIFRYIDDDLETKKDVQQKEAVLILVTCLIDVLGRVFEPFVARVMKVLMHFFGETNESIKELSLNATKLLMSRLTGYGVKVILPQLLLGLEDVAWRAKFNNIWALGNMAFCSPKQMSQCLPQIVPQLSNCLTDTHPKIRDVANSSLTLIGSTIKNPEISEIVDILIQALSDPFDLNKQGLEILLKTRFTHYIDAPALALVIPIVDYALTQKRESRPKEDACQVVGSISSLIKESKDLIPYMDILVAGLKNALADNDNEVRLFASKAIGQVSKTLGQVNTEKFFKFIKDLLENKASTSIERSGAAQALAEVMCTLGLDYFKSQLPFLFEKMSSVHAWVREGYVGVFVFVPVILKQEFNPFLKDVLDNTSQYVSDEDEKTREIALRVLRILIQNFGETQTQLLTGPVNEGLFSTNWRKRLSSVVLSSEMLEILQRIVKREHNALSEDAFVRRDEAISTEKQHLLYENFMSVYILRADEMEQIRLQSSQVWKNFVDNTPKTLRLGLHILFDKLVTAIQRGKPVDTIARTAVFNFCQKYGESFFPSVLKVFKDIIIASKSDLSRLRGCLLVLSEYCKNLQGTFLRNYQDELVDLIKSHVYTTDNMFRASVFYSLRIISERIGEIGLLKNTFNEVFDRIRACSETDPLYEIYLKIFDQLCQSKSDKIMQYIVPQLFLQPIPAPLIEVITNNAQVVARVSFKYFQKRSSIEILFREIFASNDEQRRGGLIYALNQISINLTEDDSRSFLLNIVEKINEFSKTYSGSKIQQSHLEDVLDVLKYYMINTPIHLKEFNKDLINLVNPFLFEFNCPKLAEHAVPILSSIFSVINKKYYVEILHTFALSLEDSLSREKYSNIEKIEGFNIEKDNATIQAFIELSTTCLIEDPLESFHDSIDTLKHIIKYTSRDILLGYSYKIIGPIVRCSNYKYEKYEKRKMLGLFQQIFEKDLKIAAFAPQLLTTYLKIANDFSNDQEIQKLVVSNIVNVTKVSPSADKVLREIVSRSQEEGIEQQKRENYLRVVCKLLKVHSALFSKNLIEKLFSELLKVSTADFSSRATYFNAKVLAGLSKVIGASATEIVLKKSLLTKNDFSSLLLSLALCRANPSLIPADLASSLIPIVEQYEKEQQILGVKLIQKLAALSSTFSAGVPQSILSMDVQRIALDDEDDLEDDDEEENEEEPEDYDSGESIEEDEELNFGVE